MPEQYSQLSMEQLEQMLCALDPETDPDLIFTLLDELLVRYPEIANMDIDAAWQEFKERYMSEPTNTPD